MTFALSAADVFEAAILLEERGARFYADAAARCTGEAKKLLSGLSSMEKNHAERFRSILEELRTSSSAPEPRPEEAAQYLEALTSDRIFTETISIGAKESYPEILEKAIHGDVTPEVPASILQMHPDVTVMYSTDPGGVG